MASPVMFNPTGQNGAGALSPFSVGPAPGGTSAAPAGSPGNYNFGNSGNPNPSQAPTSDNPYVMPSSTATTQPNPYAGPANSTFAPPAAPPSMNPGTAPPGAPPAGTPIHGTSGYTTGNTVTGVTATPEQFKNTFGAMSPELSGFLNSDGGYNSALTSQTVQAQDAAAQQQIALGEGTLKANLAESGISANSSVAALETSNYMSNAETQLNALNAQEYFNMWQSSMASETSLLESMEGPQAQHTASTSPLAIFGQIASDIGSLDPVSVNF